MIYGSYHRGTPFLEQVQKAYAPHEIVFICGEDLHNCNAESLTQHHHVFVRELSSTALSAGI